MVWITIVIISVFSLDVVLSHGMMLDPPGRGSLWRTNPDAKINYNDNGMFCGGFFVQYYVNGGRCGVCGDSYNATHPQDNENTGKFGEGILAGTYKAGSIVNVSILLTANHKGSFNYSLCKLQDPNSPEPEECFVPLLLANGESISTVDPDINHYLDRVQLPSDTVCDRCVLRWTYRAGNNWGVCDDGSQGIGCGDQEHFRNCADISIVE